MSESNSAVGQPTERDGNPKRDVSMILAMLAAIAIPAIWTMQTIETPKTVVSTTDASPLGYTVSLTLFLIPVLLTAYWNVRNSPHKVHNLALFGTVGVVLSVGCTLDFFFGYHFFVFPYPDATLGIRVPAWSWSETAWVMDYLPIEEFGFYSLGALFMLMIYIWADQEWLRDYHPSTYERKAQNVRQLVSFHPWILVAGAVAICAGYLYKKFGDHPYQDGFPAYYTFQVVLLFVPTMFLYKAVAQFVNWRALTLTVILLLLVSLIWEATLAIPYGWWGYKSESMLGIMLPAWTNLPIEAVLLWLVAAWQTIFCYEFLRIFLHMKRGVRHALFGRADPADLDTDRESETQ